MPPALGKTNRFESREEKELAHYPEAPSRWVEPTVSAIIKTNQFYRFFGYLIKIHNVPLIPLEDIT